MVGTRVINHMWWAPCCAHHRARLPPDWICNVSESSEHAVRDLPEPQELTEIRAEIAGLLKKIAEGSHALRASWPWLEPPP
jgi:hypothetical protein